MAGDEGLVHFFAEKKTPNESNDSPNPPEHDAAQGVETRTNITSTRQWQVVPPRPAGLALPLPSRETRQPNNANHQNGHELNASLRERFNGSRRRPPIEPTDTIDNHIPTTTATRQSNRVLEYVQMQRAPVDTDSWLSRPEFPTSNEVMDVIEDWQQINEESDTLHLEGNRPVGAWESKEEYLSTHYELLREEAVRPLREAVAWIRKNPNSSENANNGRGIGIYARVHITTLTFSHRGIGVKVSFSLNRVGKNIKWDQSKRLISGSIVALSPTQDMFRTKCIVAVVAARPLSQLMENPPTIDLFFAKAEEIEIDSHTEYVMVEERTGFYEAQRSTMLALQKMMREKFPLSKHLVEVEPEVGPPDYVVAKPNMNLSNIFPGQTQVDVLADFPSDHSQTTLDSSQLQALERILTKSLAVVQGPPGTGKTHVSVQALQALIADMTYKDPPIIIACQTNHALDQIVRHVAGFTKEFARLGGRSKDTTGVITSRTLYNLKSHHPQPKGPFGRSARVALRNLANEMIQVLKPLEEGAKQLLELATFQEYGLLSHDQCLRLEHDQPTWTAQQTDESPILERWLGKSLMVNKRTYDDELFGFECEEDMPPEVLEELEAENHPFDEDDDIERLKGPTFALYDSYTTRDNVGVTEQQVKQYLATQPNLWKISTRFRGPIYSYIVREVKRKIRDRLREKAKTYCQKVIAFQAGRWEDDWHILRDQKVIGMTTTGLSKFRALVASLEPRVVLIEEAAETLEAPVTAACMESVQHLILVGDHKQLRPQCGVKQLESPEFSLNVSLFERLVNNNIEFSVLQRQRRMIPEIRRLLDPIYGRTIKDHPSMRDPAVREPVPGMGGQNTFWFTHEWVEERNDQRSAFNDFEADMIVGFMNYLVDNGLEKKQITILTFYNGQRQHILKKLDRHPDLGIGGRKTFNVVTVDSYQGEENDIILLSLVRSNHHNEIGFLNVDNRVCVALSRARRGFYLFGNAELLASESKTWSEVVNIMASNNRIGYYLPLRCKNHDRITYIKDPNEWHGISGGCETKCEGTLTCGHSCPLRCHAISHDKVRCMHPCRKRLECGHLCASICDEHICYCGKCPSKRTVITTSPQVHGHPSSGNVRKWSAAEPPQPASEPSTRQDTREWRASVNSGVREHEDQLRARADNPFAERKTSEKAIVHALPRSVRCTATSTVEQQARSFGSNSSRKKMKTFTSTVQMTASGLKEIEPAKEVHRPNQTHRRDSTPPAQQNRPQRSSTTPSSRRGGVSYTGHTPPARRDRRPYTERQPSSRRGRPAHQNWIADQEQSAEPEMDKKKEQLLIDIEGD